MPYDNSVHSRLIEPVPLLSKIVSALGAALGFDWEFNRRIGDVELTRCDSGRAYRVRVIG
jgi:hypothetical protein